jgi:LmbE family N-acetylglucosaminyl deacetylase
LLLGFLDGSYKTQVGRSHEDPGVRNPFEEELTRSISQLLDDLQPTTVLLPLGLLHGDHQSTRKAALACIRTRPEIDALVYVDLPYGIAFEEVARRQFDEIADSGCGLDDRSEAPELSDAKLRAANCCRSQLPLLEAAFGRRLRESFEPGVERLVGVRAR